MDLSSAIAVLALDLASEDHVLDLCCAPGAKLCMIADIMGMDATGTITGVDVSPHRAATCRSMLKKYKVRRARLFVADGTRFDIRAPSTASCVGGKQRQWSERVAVAYSSMKHATMKPFWAPKILRTVPQLTDQEYLYDKVIVDAECTHDGSVAHMRKYDHWGWDTFEKNFMQSARLDDLWDLQRRLISNGWMLLKPGGILVYSTCSLTRRQNEDVVAWFLTRFKDEARLESIPSAGLLKKTPPRSTEYDADLSHAIRLDPLVSHTSGFFVVRIRKLSRDRL